MVTKRIDQLTIIGFLLVTAIVFLAGSSQAAITGKIWQNDTSQTADVDLSTLSNNPQANFSVSAIDFDTRVTGYSTPSSFLGNVSFTNVQNGFNANGSLNNSHIELTGQTYLNAGVNTFTVLHDDGLKISVTGIGTVLDVPGPTAPATTDYSINAPSAGFYSFTVEYNECFGGAAVLVMTVNGGTVANFSASPTSGTAPLGVQFTDGSVGTTYSWAWDFGDGGISTQQSPSHTYTSPGIYTVSLTTTGPGGSSSTKTFADYITVGSASGAPLANFSASPTSGAAPLGVQFTDKSVGNITNWYWDFGDGGTSLTQSPGHVYTGIGSYTVTLTASGPGGSSVKTGSITVDSTTASTRKMFWSGTAGACVWTLDTSGNLLSYVFYGPVGGWAAVSYEHSLLDGSGRMLWTSTSGFACIWSLDSSDNFAGYQVYGPVAGWTPVSYDRGPDGQGLLLWKSTSGMASVVVLDSSDNYLSYRLYGPVSGFTPLAIHQNMDGTYRFTWEYITGAECVSKLDSSGNFVGYQAFGPAGDWRVISYTQSSNATPYLTWNQTSTGLGLIMTLDASDNYLSYVIEGPFSGWVLRSFQ